ncbi:alpha/beta fold hydrolase [Nocardia nova]|uniref:alpha/beta fold hydrolase n=1 Tax=Nocardia nova TaxID=37330 RepID=UPI0033FE5CAC
MSSAPIGSSTGLATGTISFAGARLSYELRGAGTLLVLVGSPQRADSFTSVAEVLANDYTVVTIDPRGHGGSILDDPEQDSTPRLRGDDLARIITHLGRGPAVVFGSSGGAVSVLALAEAHPGLVSTVIVHEPPLLELLDDRDERHALRREVLTTFAAGDPVATGRKFMAMIGFTVPEELLARLYSPDRDPAELAEEAYFYRHELTETLSFRPDLDALRGLGPRIVIGIGESSTGMLCDHTSRALAAELSMSPTMFPGGHVGFQEHPQAFAERLQGFCQPPCVL